MIRKLLSLDWILMMASSLLITTGLLSLYTLSLKSVAENGENYFWRQLIFIFISLIVLIFLFYFNYRSLLIYSTFIYFFVLFLLIIVLFFGLTIKGTTGWLNLGLFNLQPVEIAKIGLIISLASFFSRSKIKIGEMGRVIGSFFIFFSIAILVLLQPDTGSALVLFSIWIGMLFLSGINKKYIIGLLVMLSILSIISWFFLADYQKERLTNLIYPENDPQGSGYNVIQSIIAIGSGGIVGKGIGSGSQSQLNFLPEKHTDFIFAVISEEMGLIGAIFLLIFYLILGYRIKKIAENSPDNFGYFLSGGILIMFFFQIIINIGMNMGILPVTGIPLPLVSYGGSSLIVSFASLGILNSIYTNKKTKFD